MKCVICDVEFESKRADARFCSSTCRSKASRLQPVDKVYVSSGVIVDALPAPEKEKKTLPNIDELGTLREGQTQEEYIANISERGYLVDGSKCTHPVEEHYFSRCLQCMELVPMVTKLRKPLLKQADKKK